MKTTRTIKNLLFAGVVSLTLASCGGGGGGGGGGAEVSSGSSSSSGQGNYAGNAPESLSQGMTFEFSNGVSPHIVSLHIDSSSSCRYETSYKTYNTSYTYRLTSPNTAELVIPVVDEYSGTSSDDVFKLTFTDWTKGNGEWIVADAADSVTFTVSGRSPRPSQSESDNGSSGDSSADAPTVGDNNNSDSEQEDAVVDYAPESKAGIKSIEFGPYSFSSSSVYHDNVGASGSYSYKKTGVNTASISVSGIKYSRTMQFYETLINGRTQFQNINVVLMSATASFDVEFTSNSSLKVKGKETITNYSYYVNKLGGRIKSTEDSNRSYNTSGRWKASN